MLGLPAAPCLWPPSVEQAATRDPACMGVQHDSVQQTVSHVAGTHTVSHVAAHRSQACTGSQRRGLLPWHSRANAQNIGRQRPPYTKAAGPCPIQHCSGKLTTRHVSTAEVSIVPVLAGPQGSVREGCSSVQGSEAASRGTGERVERPPG